MDRENPRQAEGAASGTAPPPRPHGRRAIGVDVARAVALIGMIAVHVFPESDEAGGMSWAFGIFGGRAAALFALLAGVSISFVEKRSRGQLHGRNLAADRVALVVRGLIILLAGLLLGYLDTPIQTVIPYFGILFILVVPLYGRSSRVLLIATTCFAILGPVFLHAFGSSLPEQINPENDYTPVTAIMQPVPFVADMLLIGFYPTLLWMVYICVGMVIGRQVLTSRKVALALVGWGALLAISTWVLSKLLLGPAGGLERLVESTPDLTRTEVVEYVTYGNESFLMPDTTWWWQAAVSPYSNTSLHLLHNLGSVLAALGIALLVTRPGVKVFSPFAAIGAMTLTLYSAHCVVLAIEVLDEDRPMLSLWVQIISFMLFAMLWRSAMGKGPLESIISDASDWARERVRKGGTRPLKTTRTPERSREESSRAAISAASPGSSRNVALPVPMAGDLSHEPEGNRR
ncbi:heparan-alpha-glucosaminide N-acetyltransferase domain-containing protein [Kocuria arenosa]|uniref:heparan-alpha-glucosaminide N-acetyltransferase domain-containing protein n=1 Tax=Kocuria arenosa TaxID=3071446 RepID=UPI0034D44F7D